MGKRRALVCANGLTRCLGLGALPFSLAPLSMLSELLLGYISKASWEGGGLNTAPVTRCDV